MNVRARVEALVKTAGLKGMTLQEMREKDYQLWDSVRANNYLSWVNLIRTGVLKQEEFVSRHQYHITGRFFHATVEYKRRLARMFMSRGPQGMCLDDVRRNNHGLWRHVREKWSRLVCELVDEGHVVELGDGRFQWEVFSRPDPVSLSSFKDAYEALEVKRTQLRLQDEPNGEPAFQAVVLFVTGDTVAKVDCNLCIRGFVHCKEVDDVCDSMGVMVDLDDDMPLEKGLVESVFEEFESDGGFGWQEKERIDDNSWLLCSKTFTDPMDYYLHGVKLLKVLARLDRGE